MTSKKKPSVERSHPRLRALIRAFESGRDAEAIEIARSLATDPQKEVRLKATRILAACLFSSEAFAESCPIWLALAQETNQGGDWLSVVTSHLRARRFEDADRYYEKAMQVMDEEMRQLDASGQGWSPGVLTVPYLIANYASAAADAGAPERAVPKIKELAIVHAQVKVTDATFLAIRGMTGFESLLDLIERVYPLTRKHPAWPEIFKAWEGLGKEGQQAVQELRQRLGL